MRRLSLSLVWAAIAWNTQVVAQDSASAQAVERPSAADSAVERPTAPVVVDGVTLFRVRGILAYPAERRAAEITDRIREIASDPTVPVDSLTIQETPQATSIVAAGRQVLAVLDADAQLEGVTRQVLAQAYQARVAEAVTAYRHDREPAVLRGNVARAILATIAFALVLSFGRRALRRLRAFVGSRYQPRIRDVEFHTIEIMRGEQLWRGVQRALGVAATLVALAAGYIYFYYVLLLFPWTRALGHSLSGILLRPLTTIGTGILRSLPDLVFLIILALIARYIIKLVRLFFRRVGNGTITLRGFEPEWALPTEQIVLLLLIAFTLAMAYPYIPGSESAAFKGIGLLLGLMVTLGSGSVIGNAVAGLTLAFRRAFKVGDRVRIGEHIGDVAQVRLLTTYLRSPKNEQITIPNSLILNSEVVNFSTLAKEAGLILHTNVGIGYETPWRQVEAMLLEAARRTPGLLSQPEPFVLQRELGDFAVDYEINVYCDNPRAMLAYYSALHKNILDVFNEYGVQIMTPAYERDPAQAKVVPREQWFAAPARAAALEQGVDGPGPKAPPDGT